LVRNKEGRKVRTSLRGTLTTKKKDVLLANFSGSGLTLIKRIGFELFAFGDFLSAADGGFLLFATWREPELEFVVGGGGAEEFVDDEEGGEEEEGGGANKLFGFGGGGVEFTGGGGAGLTGGCCCELAELFELILRMKRLKLSMMVDWIGGDLLDEDDDEEQGLG